MWKHLNFKDIISNVYYFLENYLDGMKKITTILGYFVLALCYYHRTIAITIGNIFCVGYYVYLAELFIMFVVVDVTVVYYVCASTATNDKAFFRP